MGEFQELIEKLSENRLEGLAAEDMGVLSLREVVDLLRRVRSELEAGETLAPDEITASVRSEVLHPNFANQIDSLVANMSTYGEATQNPADQRTQFKAQAEGLRNIVIDRLRPIVRTDEAKVQEALGKAQSLLDDLEAVHLDLQRQRTALAKSSATAAAVDLSTHYKTQADGHSGSAQTFFLAGVASAVVLTGLTVWFLFVSPPDYTATKTAEQWIEVVRGTVGRLALLSIAAFALAFCTRNYRVNMHLEVLNRRRENALNTFGLMQAAVTSDEARNIVVGELVRAVFTSEETGYLAAETERTVIESPGGAGVLSAMTAMARSQSQ